MGAGREGDEYYAAVGGVQRHERIVIFPGEVPQCSIIGPVESDETGLT
jgi:hypothetical protein